MAEWIALGFAIASFFVTLFTWTRLEASWFFLPFRRIPGSHLRSISASLFIAALAAGIAFSAVSQLDDGQSKATSPINQPTITTSPQPIKCATPFKITHPHNLTKISGKAGTIVRGTACSTEWIWVFDDDTYDGLLYLDTETPLPVTNNRWTFTDVPIGNKNNDDINTHYIIMALSASSLCNQTLLRKGRSTPNTPLRGLPKTCAASGSVNSLDTVEVIKARP